MNTRGHNERSFRLDALANEAREGLRKVEAGEEETIAGWLAYGLALNEGRALFPGDREFGEWVALSQLDTADRMDRAAAMWAAANADQFEEAREAGKARTIRGIHAKWKEIEAERFAEERRKVAEAAEAAKASDESPVHKSPDISGAYKAGTSVAHDAADGPAQEQYSPKAPQAPAKGDSGGEVSSPGLAPASDPYGYAKLTEAALLDTANGLRADLDDEKAKRKEAERERDEYKARWQEATGEDMGRALGNAQRARDTAKGRIAEELAKNARQARRIKILEAELATATKRLESQVIPL